MDSATKNQIDALQNARTADLLTAGQEIFTRDTVTTGYASTTGRMVLDYFTARRTEQMTQVRTGTTSTAAGATPTLARLGLFVVDGSGNGTLVASTPNDTTLWAATNTEYAKAFSAAYTLLAGQRYALGRLVVTAAAMPTWLGRGTDINPARAAFARAPRLTGFLTGLSDLPGSFTEAGLNGAFGFRFYAELAP